MRWKWWMNVAVMAATTTGCPRPNTCPPGEVLVAGVCAVDCPPGATTGCRDTGVRIDATSEAGDGAACPTGQTRCGAQCVDLATSAEHCGMCGMRCAAPEAGTATCAAGMCSLMCPSNTHACNGACVANDSIATCGTRCDPCPTPAGSRATCVSQTCGIECLAGFERVGDSCEALVPRPIFPPGTSTVSTHRPTFRWELGAGTDGAVVEVCRDRACTMRVAMFDATGTSARPSAALPASSALFWRLRGRVGATAGTRFSPTWQFRTRATDTAVDTAYGTELDINGDGFTDVAIGSIASSSTLGSVRIQRGSATGLTTQQTIDSPSVGGRFGGAIAAVGDVNGDGLGDIAISAAASTSAGLIEAGCVFVFHGSTSGVVVGPTRMVCGNQARQYFGAALSGGDVNGDGFSDLVVGAPGTTGSTSRSIGDIHVFVGGSAGVATSAAVTLFGPSSAAEVGSAISVSDLNADGFADVVAGAGTANLGTPGGGILVFDGRSSMPSTTPTILASDVSSNESFALAVDATGDLNGDGVADVVAGARNGAVAGRARPGIAMTFLGRRASAPSRAATLDGLINGDAFGAEVAIVRDSNSDGFDEVLVGAPQADPASMSFAGSAYFFRGSASGAEMVASLTIHGTALNDILGSALGSHGDINGDGRGDFSIGVPGADPMGRNGAGAALVYFGAMVPMLHRTLEGAAAGDQFGTSLVSRQPQRAGSATHRSSRWCARP